MTRRPPLPLAGRVARDVMGWDVCRDQADCDNAPAVVWAGNRWRVNGLLPEDSLDAWPEAPEWDPLANPGDLMDVIESLLDRGLRVELEAWPDERTACAYVWTSSGGRSWDSRLRWRRDSSDRRAALARAVCRAALEAVKS